MTTITQQNLQFIQWLATASHQTLLQSTNPHYFKLYEENMMFNARMNNERSAYNQSTCIYASLRLILVLRSQLKSRITELEEKLSLGQASSSLQGRSENARVLPPLLIPDFPALLERKDFSKVRFWALKDWNDYRASQQRRNETVTPEDQLLIHTLSR